jgi:hypothetical protein
MKRIFAAPATSIVPATGACATVAAAAGGGPEVDQANTTTQLAASPFGSVRCLGEGGVPYVTFRGAWHDRETGLPPATDRNLSRPPAINNIVWTGNLKTQRGVLRGNAVFSSDSASAPLKTYVGPITLITQGLPGSAGAPVPARGWINAGTLAKDAPDGGSLLANVELQIQPGFAADGEFGNMTMSFPDFSVATNTPAC